MDLTNSVLATCIYRDIPVRAGWDEKSTVYERRANLHIPIFCDRKLSFYGLNAVDTV